jgi:hypothetical protein
MPGSPSGWATRRVATGFVLHVKIAAASMSELQSVSPDVLIHLARTLQVPMKGLLATVKLLDEGSTVPFIARYRKEFDRQPRRGPDPRHRRKAPVFSRVGFSQRDHPH